MHTSVRSTLNYFQYQSSIPPSAEYYSNELFSAIEALQSSIDRALIQERRYYLYTKIPLIRGWKKYLGLVPFCDREIFGLLQYIQNSLYETSDIVYDYDRSKVASFNDNSTELLKTYTYKWREYIRDYNNVNSSNIATLNDIRIAAKNVLLAYQKWMDNTIFTSPMMRRVERQRHFYIAIADVLHAAMHYERRAS